MRSMKIIKISKEKRLDEIARRLREESPDILYFQPWMSHWTVLLAQIRIAPIQMMTHGHPATSMSNEIDYVYINEIEGDLVTSHSEGFW